MASIRIYVEAHIIFLEPGNRDFALIVRHLFSIQ